jgi:hypothetical protein
MESTMTRTSHLYRLLLLTSLAVFLVAVPSAKAAPRFFIQVGVPVPIAPVVVAPPVLPPPPAYGLVWRAGYYNWNGYGYVWLPGAWVRPPFARAVWVGPRWVRYPHGGAYWARGYWRR